MLQTLYIFIFLKIKKRFLAKNVYLYMVGIILNERKLERLFAKRLILRLFLAKLLKNRNGGIDYGR